MYPGIKFHAMFLPRENHTFEPQKITLVLAKSPLFDESQEINISL
jgi:hypothetical protein